MRFGKCLLSMALVVFLVSCLPEKSEAVESLSDLLSRAMQKSPELQKLKSEYEAKRAGVIDAWLPNDPEFGVDVESQPALFQFNKRTDNEYMVIQTIPFPTKLFLRGLSASKEADAAYQKYKEAEREVRWHIEQPYYRLDLFQKTLAALEENQILLEQILKSAKARYESNPVSQADLLKTQIEHSKISIEVFNLREKIHLEQAHISHILNEPLEAQYTIVNQKEQIPFVTDVEGLEKLALEKRPELKALEAGIERAKINRTLANSDWLPDITARYEGRQFKGDSDVRENDTFIGVTVPFWSLLKGVGGVWKSAGLEVDAAEALYHEMKNEVFLKIHEAYSKVKSAENTIGVYENSIRPQAKQTVGVLLASYESGKADFLSLLEAQRTLRNSEIEYQTTLTDYETAVSELRWIVGDDLIPDHGEKNGNK